MSDRSRSEEEDESVVGDDGEYFPRRILAEVRTHQKPMYLIEWEDWPIGAATEEPRGNFTKNTGLIDQWEREKRRIRLGKSQPYDLEEWKREREKWEKLPKPQQDAVCAQMVRDREVAEAIGNYGDASESAGSSDEAGEGPIEISDDSNGASKRKPTKFKNNRPILESSEDEESEDELVVAPNGSKFPLARPTKPKKTPRDNIGVTGYQGNANRAPLPPRTLPAEARQQKQQRKFDASNKARRDGARAKAPQKMEDKIRAAAAGQEVNNGSKKPFRNMSMAHRANKIGNTLHERVQAMPATLRSLGAEGKTVSFGQPATAATSSTSKATAPAPPAPAQAPAADVRRDSVGSSNNDAWNVVDDEDDITERRSTNFSTAAWPRMPQPEKPTEKELFKKREEALKKQIEDAKSAIVNAVPASDNANIEAAVFNACRTSSAGSPVSTELLPAPTSRGIISPSNTLGAIADGNATSNAGPTRPRAQVHRPRTDPLFVQTTKERIANQDRVPRPISLRPDNATVNNIPQALPPPGDNARPAARTSMSFHGYQASRRASGSASTPVAPPTAYRAVSESGATVGRIASEEMVGCRYEDLLPHLANPSRESDAAYYYLLFPSAATPLADTITKWLRKASGFAKVFHCQQLGSWTKFVELTQSNPKKLNGGCLIVHSSLRHFIPKQPQMMTFLLNGNNTIWCADENAPNGRILSLVFKAGGTILITPRMFETEPQKTAHILNWFLSHKLPHTRGKIWKLALLRHMTSYLHDLWQRKAKEREELIRQYRQIGESHDNMEKTAATRRLAKTDIEMMAQNLRLVQKIKQSGLPLNPISGTKEAETVFIELSGAIGYEDEVAIVEGFAMYALIHWEPTRKWIVVGTGEPAHKALEKKEQKVIADGNVRPAEEQSNGVNNNQHNDSSASTNGGGHSPQSLADAIAAKQKGLTIPVTTADNIDRNVFMVNTGVRMEVADHYLEQALGDIGLALRLREIDMREGTLPENTMDYAGKPASPHPDQNGNTAMEDASQECGEIQEISPLVNGAPPPTPPEMVSSPSKQLQTEIAANEVAMEDAVSMVPDTAPPPPLESAPPPPPAKIKFSMPSPSLNKKSPPIPQGISASESAPAPAPAPGSTADNAMDIDIDMSAPGLVQDKPRLETRPTVEWYKEREMENTDWKHIWVRSYGQAIKFFNIGPEWDLMAKKPLQQQQQQQPQQK